MKSTRQDAILEIIGRMDVETQEELADELRTMGFKVTQATVSRDIKELRLVKALTSNGAYKYAVAEKNENTHSERFIRIFSESVLTISHAYNQIVLKTLPGSANVAAETIDGMRWPEILGTLAGDNTILMIVRSTEEVELVLGRINDMIH